MQTSKRFLIMSLMILAVLSLVACGGSEKSVEHQEPYHLEEIAGSDFKLVVLTEKAAERLDIQSEEVREEEVDGEMKLTVPYAAVIYGLNGETFLYARNPGAGSLKFIREPITVDRIEGGKAILSDDPGLLGTHAVTVGVSELYGAETGVGK